ncbi:MAG TPA: hypothetical protein V6D22_15080 [Candidatus Obscuribacterales bacterium]
MKLSIQLTTAALLVVLGQSAALAQYYNPYQSNNPYYPANVQGYYPAYAGGVYGYNGYSPYNVPSYGGATINSDGSMNNNGVSWNGADPTGGATGVRNVRGATAAYANPASGGASGLLPPQPGVRRGFINNALRQPVYHLYRPRAFTYHD